MYLPVHAWLAAFLLTVVVEVPIVAWLLRGRDAGGWRLVMLVVFANLATHPAVWFIFPQLLYVSTPQFLVASELWAFAAEAVFYRVAFRGVTPGRAFGTSLAANAVSFVVGLVVAELFPQLFI